MHYCNAPLTRLTLHSIKELCSNVFDDEDPATVCAMQLPYLRHLAVIAPREGPADDAWFPDHGHITNGRGLPTPASWLFSLQSLRTFEVTMRPECHNTMISVSVSEVIEHIKWPSLKSIRLEGTALRPDCLERFLLATNRDRYEHLDELVIIDPITDEAYWNQLILKLENTQPGPTRLELTKALKHQDYDPPFGIIRYMDGRRDYVEFSPTMLPASLFSWYW